MKKRMIAGSLLVVAALAAAGATVADQRGGMGQMRGEGRMGQMGAMSFADLDTDGNGRFSPEDMAARADARFAELDADGDGQVSREEFLAHSAARASDRAGEMFDRLDADGDGVLSRDAIEARGGPGRGVERMIARFDTDNDGALSEAEFDTALANMREHGGRGGHEGREGRGGPRFGHDN